MIIVGLRVDEKEFGKCFTTKNHAMTIAFYPRSVFCSRPSMKKSFSGGLIDREVRWEHDALENDVKASAKAN
jgi:hypothetical protein